jgi:hypothetical protein
LVGNRFSILADLNSSATQAKGTFDYSTTSAPSRSRKRGSKHIMLNNHPLETLEAQYGEGLISCGKNVEDSRKPGGAATSAASSQVDFTSAYTLNSVRHHWLPQFRPNSGFPQQIGAEATLVRPPERCLTKVHHCSLPTPSHEQNNSRKLLKPLGNIGGQLANTVRTPAQKAAAAARRAVGIPVTDDDSSAFSSGREISNIASPAPLAQVFRPRPLMDSVSLERSLPKNLVYTTSPITARPTASPTSSTSPVVPASTMSPTSSASPVVPASTRSPNTFPTISHPPLDSLCPKPRIPLAGSAPSVTIPATIYSRSLITAPFTSLQPFIVPSKKSATTSSTSPFLYYTTPEAIASKSKFIKLMPESLFRTTAPVGTDKFLQIGHSNPCWCGFSHQSTSTDSVARRPSLPRNQNISVRKRKYDDTELATDMDTLTFSPSTPSAPLELALEDLGNYINDVFTPKGGDEGEILTPNGSGAVNHDACVPSSGECPSEEDDWNMIDTAPSTTGASTPSEFEFVSTPTSVISMPSHPSPALPATRRRSLNPKSEPFVPNSPSLLILLSDLEILEGVCPVCMEYDCTCTVVSTSAEQWPTLQEAKNIKLTRRERSMSAYKGSSGDKSWDAFDDYFL